MPPRIARRILPALAAAAALVVIGAQSVQAAPAHTASTTVSVTASEFKFKLSTSTVKHGAVSFKITNKGKIPHDFKINGKKSSLVSPGKTVTLSVTFSKAGSFAYSCTVTGHAQLGMKGTLKVT
jgi:uncharacterized cupredoxin-like copper-binding protein